MHDEDRSMTHRIWALVIMGLALLGCYMSLVLTNHEKTANGFGGVAIVGFIIVGVALLSD